MDCGVCIESDRVVVPVHLKHLGGTVLDGQRVVVAVEHDVRLLRLGSRALLPLSLLLRSLPLLLLRSLPLLLLLLHLLLLLLTDSLGLLSLSLLLGCDVLRKLNQVVKVWHVLHELLHVAHSTDSVGYRCVQINLLGLALALAPA